MENNRFRINNLKRIYGPVSPLGPRAPSPVSPAYQSGLRRWLRTSGCQAGANLLAWLSALLIRELWGRIGDLWTQRADSRRRSRRIRAERRLIEILGELRGPFVKIGQFASLRYDVLSADTREALTSLQEHVPPARVWRHSRDHRVRTVLAPGKPLPTL